MSRVMKSLQFSNPTLLSVKDLATTKTECVRLLENLHITIGASVVEDGKHGLQCDLAELAGKLTVAISGNVRH